MRNALLTAAAAAIALAAAAAAQGPAQAPGPDAPRPAVEAKSVPPSERAPLLRDIDAYLAKLDVLQGSFYQIEPTGSVSQGKFWIDRKVPVGAGRMRFEYADPNPYTLISDGANYTVWDRELEDINTQVALSTTPLHMFLKKDVDVAKDAEVVDLAESPGEIALTLKDRDERVQGRLKLVFARPSLELRSFSTTDDTGAETQIVLTDAVAGGSVDPSLFLVREPRRRERR